MIISHLAVENVKRVRAIEITPEGNVVEIAGSNGAGKSSILDAIWLALGGGAASKETAQPVRQGEDKACSTLTFDDGLRVERKWSGDRSTLTVTDAKGRKLSNPQGVLNELIGRRSIDPLEFDRLKPSEQRDVLLGMVDLGIDLDQLARDRQQAYDVRLDLGRAIKAIGDPGPLIPGVPEEEVSASELIEQIQAVRDEQDARDLRQQQFDSAFDEQSELESELAKLRDQMTETLERLTALREHLSVEAGALANLPPLPDPSELRAQLRSVEETNADVRANRETAAKQEQVLKLEQERAAMTRLIESFDTAKQEALAEAQFPVEGLGFDDAGVTYNGVPWADISSAERIRISTAMAMSADTEVKVLQIRDGSLLDDQSLAEVARMAEERGWQIWIERVGPGSADAVVIADGEVVEL